MPHVNISLFAQLLQQIDRNSFQSIVRNHDSDKHHKGVSSWTHLVSMLFCHLAKAHSIREISTGLCSATGNLNHLGVGRTPCKSSVAYINRHRSWKVFRDLYFALLTRLEPSLQKQRLYGRKLKRKIFIMDSTVIPLCLKLFDWARFRKQKGAIKLHTVLDYDTHLPVYLHMTEGKTHDVTMAKEVNFPPQSVVVVDRAYADYSWLNDLDSNQCFFVTRLKDNAQIELWQSYLTDEKDQHILSDEDVKLTGFASQKKYPKKLRVVRVYDEKQDRYLAVLTNNRFWTAKTISDLYKARWDIETFFKQIKQVLKIKTFIGTSPNAVLIQVWTAMIAILLLKFLQRKAQHDWHLSNLACLLRINLFVKIDLWQWVDRPFLRNHSPPSAQATLFA